MSEIHSLFTSAVGFVNKPGSRLLVALVVTVGLVVLLVEQKPVPDAYWTITGAVVGFYFGGNTIELEQ